MKTKKRAGLQFAVCIDNSDYPAALELHKVYRVLPDVRAAKDQFIRVVDESGEDYLYSVDRFVPVELPRKAVQSVTRQSMTKQAGNRSPGVRETRVRPSRSAATAQAGSRSADRHRKHARES